ncbi:MAG TPA: hypothetical protein VGO66_12130 [Solirubrobacterales bacterium]|jgi:hypothetical protein|nr:hypothetical protein [Solirubrobacterales bacterium]
MRRVCLIASLAVWASLLASTSAQAAVPTLGPPSATNLQGVSALLKGTVDPEGLATTYRFEYSSAPSFAAPTSTLVFPAGQGTDPRPARAAISGLAPSTTYHYRLAAANSSGTTTSLPASFTTAKGFGFLPGSEGFAVAAIAEGGGGASGPGAHPYQLSFVIGLNKGGEFEDQPGAIFGDGDLRDLRIEAPPGLIVNPAALPKCGLAEFHTPRVSPYEASRSGESCPDRTQLGTVEVQASLEGGKSRRFGLFNLEPAPGIPAQLGFAPFGSPVILNEGLRPNPDGSYVMTLEANNVPQALDLHGLSVVLWGAPWAISHNPERGNCLNEAEPDFPWAKCSVGLGEKLAYLTMPHRCSGNLAFSAAAGSWQQGAAAPAIATARDDAGAAVAMGPCTGFPFAPQPLAQLTDTKASSPSGYNFQLTVDNTNLTDPGRRAPAPVKTVSVVLPNGVTINPSVGAGLSTCSPAQFAAESAFSAQGAACPNAAKLGDFTVRSALFADLLEGSVYLASPYENPFANLVSVYLVAKLPSRGVLVKLPGRIDPNPSNGNLVANFDGLPQLPYSELNLTFRTGQRAFLITPPACGAANTTTTLLPWAGTGVAQATTATQIKTGIGGGPCPAGAPLFNPDVLAGGVNSNVNSYTPYFIHIARKDTEAEITSYSLVLPKGITGKLAGIPFCSEAAIAAARVNRGFAEATNPSCPAASKVGHTDSGYGVGSSLTYATGQVYLAGPYNGRPLSLVAINPATVGPFDLGTIVVRSAFSVDPRTAQLQIDSKASDPIPHILGGIPIHLRDLRIYMDRPNFTHNPSSCEASSLISTLGGSGANFATTADDTIATTQRHFQLLNCLTLGFKPKLGVRLRGSSRRGGYPELRATFAARGPQDSNLKEITVSLPKSEFLAQNHIKGICTKVQFNADRCPADSVYGSAVAYTPLFDEPLRGDVYLRSSAHRLPDLVASLHAGEIKIILEGEIGPTKQGGIETFFAELPDEPLDKFTMTLHGGRRGLLQNSYDICKEPPLATVKALGQNNIGAQFTTTLRGQCKGKAKKKAKRGRR